MLAARCHASQTRSHASQPRVQDRHFGSAGSQGAIETGKGAATFRKVVY